MSMPAHAEEHAMEISTNSEALTALDELRNRVVVIEEHLKDLPKLVESMPERGAQNFVMGLVKSLDLTVSLIKRAIEISVSQQYLREYSSNASRSSKI